MSFVGIDGCRIGWCCIELTDDNGWSAFVASSIDVAWERYRKARAIYIDIPIGLRDEGAQPRLCEVEARRRLGTRSSTVFTPPLRGALSCSTYEEASAHNFERSGKNLSRQAWGIAAKILEVDVFLANQPSAVGILREVHPEILFWSLNERVPLPNRKKSRIGKAQRQDLLSHHLPETDQVVDAIRAKYLKKEVADDDILDALVAAVCARKCLLGRALTLPEQPERDALGLPMEMVYPVPSHLRVRTIPEAL